MQIENDNLKELLQKKEELVTEARGLSKEIEEISEKRQELIEQVNELKNEIVPIIEAEYSQLAENEVLEGVELEDGEIVCKVTTLEQFKEDAVQKAEETFKEIKKISEEVKVTTDED